MNTIQPKIIEMITVANRISIRLKSQLNEQKIFLTRPVRFIPGVLTFEWFSIIAGWILSLLFVSAVGGIIRR